MMKDEQEDTQNKLSSSPVIKKQKSEETAPAERNFYPTTQLNTGYSGPQWGLLEKEIEYLFQNSKDYICIVEFGGHFKRLNKVWQELLGWEIQELLDVPYINFVHPEDVEKTLEYEKKFTPVGFVNRYRCKDGSYRYLDWIGLSRIRDDQTATERGPPLSIARDVTLQKILEKELEYKLSQSSSENWYAKQKVLEAIVEIQASRLLETYKNSKNDNSYPSLQVAIHSLISLGKSEYGFIGTVTFEERDMLAAHYIWGDTFSSQESDEMTDLLTHKERTKKLEALADHFSKVIFLKNKPLLINDLTSYFKEMGGDSLPDLSQIKLKSFFGVPLIVLDEMIGIVGLFNSLVNYDEILLEILNPVLQLSGSIINEIRMHRIQKEILREQQIARKQVEDVSLAKSSFLAHMSHEIRTPLTGLLGMLDLINKEYLYEEDLQYLQTARGSGLSLLTILNDILDISKIEAGQLTIEEINFNPIIIAHEVVQLFTIEAKKKDVELKLTTSSHIPFQLIGDPTRFRQILSNLVSNAVKFTEKGSVSILLDGICDNYNNRQLNLIGDVIDTGIGIPLVVQERLFKPFFQVDSSVTRRFGGTGLGLYITKMLCEKMKGDISVFSEMGKGSTFHFKIRLGLPEVFPRSSSTEGNLQQQAPDILPNFRILVAEDNAVNQMLLKVMLTKAGCSVTTVSNGQEALDAITTDHYDLVLMDGGMPVMDGLEATKKIREIFNAETLPIIGVTAHAMTEDREKFLNVGMNGYLTKPIQKEGLFTEIIRCSRKR